MLLRVKGVAFDQHRAALLHRALHDGPNFLVEYRVANRLVARQFSEVGGYSMPGVQGEELAFDKCHQVIS